MARKNRSDIYAEAVHSGPYDEYPLLELGIEPQLHLSRNDRVQPFYLICEQDTMIAQMSGEARIEFKNASVNYFDAVLGDFIYVPGGTAHRIVPKTPSIHVRYKPEYPGLEAVAWYSEATGKELSRVTWDCVDEAPQDAYLRACTAFNADPVLRTCKDTGAVLPEIDLTPYRWSEIAAKVRAAEADEGDRAARQSVRTAQRSEDLRFRPPPTKTEPLRVNVYEFARSATSSLNPIFPYLGPGCMVPCTTMHDPGQRGPMGYFLHENTVQEVNVCFGARSTFRRSGAVYVGPKHHGVGRKAEQPHAHGVGEKPSNADRADMISISVITQRQAVGIPQKEAFSLVCERCDTLLMRHDYDAHVFPDAIEGAWSGDSLGLPTLSQDANAAERFNADPALRTCKSCGHLNAPFPIDYWGWQQYRRRTHIMVAVRNFMAEAVELAAVIADSATTTSSNTRADVRPSTAELNWHLAADNSALPEGGTLDVTIDDRVYALYRHNSIVYATDGICTHAYARLAQGYLEDTTIECPFHGGSFDIRNGKALSAPCQIDLTAFPVEIRGEAIYIGLPARVAAASATV
jgi:3-hydroxyanthranilate 3,4-dioxygenase